MAYDFFPNVERRTLSIEWEILGCGEYKLPTYGSPDAPTASTKCGPFNLAADVYINEWVAECLRWIHPPLTLRPPVPRTRFSHMTQITFRLTQFMDLYCEYTTNASLDCPVELLIVWIYRIRELTSFRTEHELHPSETSIDSYAFHVFGFAIAPSTNLSIDIARFAIADTFDGFTISTRGMNVTKDFIYNAGKGLTTTEILAHALEVGISRSNFTQGLTMCMLVTNWVLTLVSTYYAFVAVRKGRVDFAIIILHASTGLAVSAIQKLYASPPPFGEPIGTLRSRPSVSWPNNTPPRRVGIFHTDHYLGVLLHDVGVQRSEVIPIDQGALPKSREGLIPRKVGAPSRIGHTCYLCVQYHRRWTTVFVSVYVNCMFPLSTVAVIYVAFAKGACDTCFGQTMNRWKRWQMPRRSCCGRHRKYPDRTDFDSTSSRDHLPLDLHFAPPGPTLTSYHQLCLAAQPWRSRVYKESLC